MSWLRRTRGRANLIQRGQIMLRANRFRLTGTTASILVLIAEAAVLRV